MQNIVVSDQSSALIKALVAIHTHAGFKTVPKSALQIGRQNTDPLNSCIGVRGPSNDTYLVDGHLGDD